MTSESGLLTDDDILKKFREQDNTLMEADKDDNNDDQEVGSQRPTAATISEAIDTQSSLSLFTDKGANKICHHLNQLMHIIEKNTRRSQRQIIIDSFFPCAFRSMLFLA